jgi:hypothetical protein
MLVRVSNTQTSRYTSSIYEMIQSRVVPIIEGHVVQFCESRHLALSLDKGSCRRHRALTRLEAVVFIVFRSTLKLRPIQMIQLRLVKGTSKTLATIRCAISWRYFTSPVKPSPLASKSLGDLTRLPPLGCFNGHTSEAMCF